MSPIESSNSRPEWRSQQHTSKQIDKFVREHGDVISDPGISWVIDVGRKHLASLN